MIELLKLEKHSISIKRTWRGSFDCQFSPHYSEITSLNLATLSDYVYEREEKLEPRLLNAFQYGISPSGYTFVFRHHAVENAIQSVVPFKHEELISRVDTQGFFFEDPENLYLVFRGTQQIKDWLANVDGKSVRSTFCHGNVHGGFHNALKAVLPQLKTILDARDKTKNVVICGHSLGGALATLCAAWVRENYTSKVMLYTYGSPRAGCRDFVDHYTKTKPFPAFRVANPTDLVPSVPWDTASWTARRATHLPLVLVSPMGWLVMAANDDIRESPETMRYIHLGTPVSLQASGFSVVGNPAHLDGEFASGVQKAWKRMPLPDFIAARSDNINHHLMPEYLTRLRKDFQDDCRNWAHGDPKPFQESLVRVERKLADVEAELRIARDDLMRTLPQTKPDATRVATTIPPGYSEQEEVSPELRVRALEAHREDLKIQTGMLKARIGEASTEGRKRSLDRISNRPFDGYLEEELLRHAG